LKILLDENFPLALYRNLIADGEDVEHIITLGSCGASDLRIRRASGLPLRRALRAAGLSHSCGSGSRPDGPQHD